MSLFSSIRRWDLVIMLVILAVLGIFELLGVFSPRMVTVTQIVKAVVPMPVRFMVYAWFGWHFIVSDLVRQVQNGK